jgi:hypothetical protein
VALERTAGGTSLIDVLERVLDKGIAIDSSTGVGVVVYPWMQISLERADVRRAFAGGASSVSSRRRSEDDDGSGNSGSSGAPALIEVHTLPRRRPPTRPRRTHDG